MLIASLLPFYKLFEGTKNIDERMIKVRTNSLIQ